MSIYNLFLDDERVPLDVTNFSQDPIYKELSWFVVRTAFSFKAAITEQGIPDVVSFDNDIQDFSGDEGAEITGYMLAHWLINYCIDHNLKFPRVVQAHSRNCVDQPKILGTFDNARRFYPELT